MSDFFVISPSEALLIGRCFGQYESLDGDSPRSHFLYFLDRHLSPLAPQVPLEKLALVPNESVPVDLRWSEVPGDATTSPIRVGHSPSESQTYYIATGKRMARVWRDHTARFLPHLLVDLLDDVLVRRTLLELATYPPRRGQDWAQHQINHWCNPQGARDSQSDEVEDSSKVEERLMALISSTGNEYAKLFETGRILGRLYYLCDCAEALTWIDLFDTSEQDWEDDPDVRDVIAAEIGLWQPLGWETFCGIADKDIGRLLGGDVLPLSSLARSLLRAPWNNGSGAGHIAAILDVRAVGRLREALSLATGEIAAKYLKDERAAPPTAQPPLAPRHLGLSPQSATEKIGSTINWIEEAVMRGDPLTAENVISMLAPGIEALSMRNWPNRFANRSKSESVSDILREMAARGDETESRFANMALSLYKAYRNPVQHHFDRFSCTLQEAFSFLQTMKTLFHLSNQIVAAARR